MASIPFDYHSHHKRCGHAAGEMPDYIEAAIARGITTFGVSDHGPAYWLRGDHAKPGTQMAGSEFPHYVTEARALQARYAGQIDVRVGVEADYIEGREADLKKILDTQPLDYALGSVHYAGKSGASIFDRSRWEKERAETVYADYYRLVALAAASGMFDILSHLTAIEAYGPPLEKTLAERLYTPAADAVAESGCIVEINTSGYRKMGGNEPFPNRRMLRLLIERGVPLTFGSDCHTPDQVSFESDRVADLLGELGVPTQAPRLITVRRGPILTFVTRDHAA